MDKLEKLNTTVTSEADKILHEHELLAVLGKYGNPVVVGQGLYITVFILLAIAHAFFAWA